MSLRGMMSAYGTGAGTNYYANRVAAPLLRFAPMLHSLLRLSAGS